MKKLLNILIKLVRLPFALFIALFIIIIMTFFLMDISIKKLINFLWPDE